MADRPLHWCEIPLGEPTLGATFLENAPPHMVRPKDGSSINLAWNIRLGEPTPDPALLAAPATAPHLIEGSMPVNLSWNIPIGEPAPD